MGAGLSLWKETSYGWNHCSICMQAADKSSEARLRQEVFWPRICTEVPNLITWSGHLSNALNNGRKVLFAVCPAHHSSVREAWEAVAEEEVAFDWVYNQWRDREER